MDLLNFKLSGILAISFLLFSCGGNKFEKSKLDELIRDLPDDQVFSVILHDMDVQGNFFETYHHQYKIIQENKSREIDQLTTEWLEVGKNEFNQHVNNMGMEIAARDSIGKLNKSVAPAGYNNYVGNSKYGRWENRGGSSFWAFYGQYAFMSSMFNMMAYPVRRSYYSDWRGSYYGTGRGYYGPTSGGRPYYGTNSAHGQSTNPNSTWSRNRSSFKRRVASRTSRSSSSGGARSRGRSFGK
jgi:hypothetical protein